MKTDFPIFKNNPKLIYLDSAATTQKPQSVIDAEKNFYEKNYASVHRGVYRLSQGSTSLYEGVREKVRQFINAKHDHEVIFTKGTTESINLVAHSFGLSNFKSGDEIILSVAEHHANIVPWQAVCEKTGAKLIVIPLLNETCELNFDAYLSALNPKTKLVAITHISNVLVIINPVKKIIDAAHANNTPVLLDGAQAVAHVPVDMQALDCDFYVFSAHKLYGPTGVGILYGKEKFLEKMPPYQTGGHMIRSVSFEKTEFGELPLKFEAGTPNIAGVIGLGAAIDYLCAIESMSEAKGSASASARETQAHNKVRSFDVIRNHEQKLLNYAISQLQKIPALKIYGLPTNIDNKIGVISFSLNTTHPHDIATVLDQSNIAVRAGHHCAMPLMHYFNIPALARVSFGIYNALSDIDALMIGLENTEKIFHE